MILLFVRFRWSCSICLYLVLAWLFIIQLRIKLCLVLVFNFFKQELFYIVFAAFISCVRKSDFNKNAEMISEKRLQHLSG